MLFKAFVFGVTGLGLEVTFTSVLDSIKTGDNRLLGYSSPWYAPVYMSAVWYFQWSGPWLFSLAWPLRGVIYILSFWILEFCSMGLLRILLGKSPSEDHYKESGSRWAILNLTRLDYAPAHCLLGFIFEWIFRNLS